MTSKQKLQSFSIRIIKTTLVKQKSGQSCEPFFLLIKILTQGQFVTGAGQGLEDTKKCAHVQYQLTTLQILGKETLKFTKFLHIFHSNIPLGQWYIFVT